MRAVSNPLPESRSRLNARGHLPAVFEPDDWKSMVSICLWMQVGLASVHFDRRCTACAIYAHCKIIMPNLSCPNGSKTRVVRETWGEDQAPGTNGSVTNSCPLRGN